MSYNEKLRCDKLTKNYERALAWKMSPEWELYTAVVTMMVAEKKFYESGNDRVDRVCSLVEKCDPEYVARLAVYAREHMHLRSVPLLLLVELARCHKGDDLVRRAVALTVQRADEITELLMCYQWRARRRNVKGLSCQLRKGLADAFNGFDEYQFAKYNRKDRLITLRDALLIVHPKPRDERQAAIFKKILDDTLETPFTWETQLSAAGQGCFSSTLKEEEMRQVWQDMISSHRLGYMATLRNLRNMLKLNLDDESIKQVCEYLANPVAVSKSKQMPFRFLSAYMQLIQNGKWQRPSRRRVRPRRSRYSFLLSAMRASIQAVEEAIAEKKNGIYPALVRKVRHFPLGAYTLFNRTDVPDALNYKCRDMHSRYTVLVKKFRSEPSQRNLRDLQKLEWRLRRLRKRESQLERLYQRSIERRYDFEGRVMRRFGENGVNIIRALETAVTHSASNIAGFDESTRVLIASDTSGSMMRPISEKSSVMCYYIGIMLSMLMRYRCKNVVTGMFASFWATYDPSGEDILRNTLYMARRSGEVGCSTNGYKVVDWLIAEKRIMDKVLIFTDCQLWNNALYDAHIASSWDTYKHIAPDAKLYIFDLAGYGTAPISMERDDVFCIAGWSDKVFDVLAALERGSNAIDEIRRIVL